MCIQEKTFNPYYALVGQHLCRTAHSYKITIQFCLWDFLRDLGEASVGGAELIKNLKDGDTGFNLQHISSARLKNVARVYAWWIAKNCVTLAILKVGCKAVCIEGLLNVMPQPVDFTIVKTRTQEFLRELLLQIFIDSQVVVPRLDVSPSEIFEARNKKTIEEIFIKATRIESLAMGLVYFMTGAFKNISGAEPFIQFVKWADDLSRNTLRTGIDVIPTL